MSGAAPQSDLLRVAYVPLRYPTLSQTFIQREVQGLSQHGLALTVYPCLPQWDKEVELPPDHPPIKRPRFAVSGFDLFRLVLGGLLNPRLAGFVLPKLLRLPLMRREHAMQTLAGLFAGYRLAAKIKKKKVDLIHASWATAPATAAWTASRITGIPFSFGAHAYDVYRYGGDPFLKEKLHDARMIHTTTLQNVDYLGGLEETAPEKIVLARRGLPGLPYEITERTLWNRKDPICILSVARLVEKKGLSYQLQACRKLLDMRIPFELRIVGDGPLRADLIHERNSLGLGEQVKLVGAKSNSEVSAFYAWADMLLHTGVVDKEGDRDGLPNVIPEAMSYGLPVISSPEPGATEAVEDGVTGRVVDVTNAEELAQAILQLKDNWQYANQLGLNGRQWVEENFLTENNTGILAEGMRAAVGRKD